MSTVNTQGYICSPRTKNNEFLVKHFKQSGTVYLGQVIIPKNYIGKKVMFQMYIIEDEE